jgi:predicted glutamine amidotransferase
MCIAIYNNNDLLTKRTLNNCWTANDDGAGMLWVQDGQLQTFKELKSFKAYWKKYREVREITNKVVLHFRIRTHGHVNVNNIHPFVVDETVGFVHNGIITEFSDYTSPYSDTWHFNEFLKTLPKNFIKSEGCVELITNYIGSYNKLIFLGSDNEVTIVNEHVGMWDGESWFSNNSYKDASLRYYGHQLGGNKGTTGTNGTTGTTKAISPYANYSKFDDDYWDKKYGVDSYYDSSYDEDMLDEQSWNNSFVDKSSKSDVAAGICTDCGIELMRGYGDDLEKGVCVMCKAHSNYMKNYTELSKS